jgi:hypothetical protein
MFAAWSSCNDGSVGQSVVSPRRKITYPNRPDEDHSGTGSFRNSGHSTLGSKGVGVTERGFFCDIQ